MLSDETPYSSGSVNYGGDIFVSVNFREKAGKRLFLGIDLSFNKYRLDLFETSSTHFGLANEEDLKYNFNYMYFNFYPELVFGKPLQFFLNTGLSAGILLNSNKSGTIKAGKFVQTQTGHYIEITEKDVDESARDNLSNFNIGGRIGIGFRYYLDDVWAIELEAGGMYTPFPVKDSFVNSQLDMMISLGVQYHIHKDKKNRN